MAFYASCDFLGNVFLKNEKNIRRAILLYYLKERFNKMKIEIDSENESQMKRIRKPALLLSQEESPAKKVEKYHCLFGKSQTIYKERDISQKFSRSKTFALFFPHFECFFFKF